MKLYQIEIYNMRHQRQAEALMLGPFFFFLPLFEIASCVLTASIYMHLNRFMWILIFCYNCVIFGFFGNPHSFYFEIVNVMFFDIMYHKS